MEVQNLILSFDDLSGTACNVTIPKKTPLQQYFHIVLFI